MPPGPRKRRRRRRTESSSPGFSASADESHESDETTSCPNTPDQGKLTFSSPLDMPSDQKFQTEEWVRISDFNVGTPTSATADAAKADYGVVALDGNGNARGHDKLADWETVSRDVGGISSTEEVVENTEGDDLVVDELVSPSQGQGLEPPPLDNGNLERLSEKQDEQDEKTSSSRTSEDCEKISSSPEAGSPSKEEDQEAASTMESQENVHVQDCLEEAALQQKEHDNGRQKSHVEVHPRKLQEQEEACDNGNESLPEEEREEEHHVTTPGQEDSKRIRHAPEEDKSIQPMEAATISGMDESGDQSTEAADVAPREPQEDNVKGISEQANVEHDDEHDQQPEVGDLQKVAIEEESPSIEEPSDAPAAVVSEAAEPSIRAHESEQFSVSNQDAFTDAVPTEYENMHLSEDLSTRAEVEKDSSLTERTIAPGPEHHHRSDENLSCPDAPDDREERTLSLPDTPPNDKSLQTEEWVKVSDFDVGTPTSATADSRADYDMAAEKSYGDVRGHDDKLPDWETVSRDTLGASSSVEEAAESLEGGEDRSAVDDSVSSSQGQGLELLLRHEEKGDSECCLSEKRNDRERVSLGSEPLIEVSEDKEKISNCCEACSPGKEEDQEAASTVELQETDQESSSPEVPSLPEHVQPEPEEEQHVTNPTQEDNRILSNSLEENGSVQDLDTTVRGVDESGDDQSVEAADFSLQEPPREDNNIKGISEQENDDELDQLVDIADSTELTDLGKQEEKIIAREEEDLGGKNVLEPLADVLASAETSLQLTKVEGLQNVAVEETPLVQDGSDAPDAVVSEEAAEPSSRGQEESACLVEQQSSRANADSFTDAIPWEYETAARLPADLSTAGYTSQTDGADLGKGLLSSVHGSGSNPEDLPQYNSPRKSEGQLRSMERWDGSTEIRGCCEPVHWILAYVFGRQID